MVGHEAANALRYCLFDDSWRRVDAEQDAPDVDVGAVSSWIDEQADVVPRLRVAERRQKLELLEQGRKGDVHRARSASPRARVKISARMPGAVSCRASDSSRNAR